MSRPTRTLFFSSGLAPEYGGAAISEASLCQFLGKLVQVNVMCRQDRWNRKFAREYGLSHLQEYNPQDLFHCWKNKNHPNRSWFKNIDLVHLNGHWRWEYFFVSKICQELSIPYVVHPRGMMLVAGRKHHLKKIFNLLIGNSIAQKAERIVALSQYEIQQLAPYGVSDEQVTVIPNGVCFKEEPLNPSEPTRVSDHFLYFGRLEHRKNLLFLIEAYARYRQLGGTKKLRLKGPIEHGYEQLVIQKSESLQMSHHVSILAPTYGQDKWRHLSQSTAVVYPGIDEPFGRVPFETLLAGGLPIVPRESGGAEYLRPVLPQSIYSTNDCDALAERLLWAEGLNTRDRSELLTQAQAWVKENLEWEKVSNQVYHLYEKAILSPRQTQRSLSSLGFLRPS